MLSVGVIVALSVGGIIALSGALFALVWFARRGDRWRGSNPHPHTQFHGSSSFVEGEGEEDANSALEETPGASEKWLGVAGVSTAPLISVNNTLNN